MEVRGSSPLEPTSFLAPFRIFPYNKFVDEKEKTVSPEETRRVIEKRYIEVNPSARLRFLYGLLGGIGWGIGLSIGTAAILYLIGFVVSKIDFIPVLGQFLAEVIKSTQGDLNTR
ncbi:MAG: DUF5665 domain-containing protein [Patescibacteria group bacterium]